MKSDGCNRPRTTHPPTPELGFFERYLTVWVLACIGAGIGLGQLEPGAAAAIAAVVGVLIEVPVMLLVVRAVNFSRPWYEAGPAMPRIRATGD